MTRPQGSAGHNTLMHRLILISSLSLGVLLELLSVPFSYTQTAEPKGRSRLHGQGATATVAVVCSLGSGDTADAEPRIARLVALAFQELLVGSFSTADEFQACRVWGSREGKGTECRIQRAAAAMAKRETRRSSSSLDQ
mgnify:CR=1 FL=1